MAIAPGACEAPSSEGAIVLIGPDRVPLIEAGGKAVGPHKRSRTALGWLDTTHAHIVRAYAFPTCLENGSAGASEQTGSVGELHT